jgi:hypothetical protein
VLCTSQEALGLDREYAWPLQPLAEDAAAALFDERARAVRPELLDDRDTVAIIVDRLDRLPLAIELAAARVSTFSPSEIAGLLDDRFDLLMAGGRGRLPRHRGLAAMVQWSHELLEPDEQRLFRRLGVFAGGFTHDAAIQVTQDEHTNRTRLAIALDQLVRRSLVVADVGSGATRYRMLETLRHYALDRLAESGETDIVARRHAEWCAELALGFQAVDSPDETAWLARGIAEFDNLRAAVGFAVDHRDTDLAVRLVGRLWRLRDLGRFELVDWARQVLALPGAADHPDVGYVHTLVALLTFVTNDIDACASASEEALQRPLEEDAWTRVCVMKTSVLMIRDRWKDSGVVFRHALETVTRPRNRLRLLGNAASGDAWMRKPSGIEVEQLIADADATMIPGLQAHVRCMIAQTCTTQDRALDAVRLARESLQILQPGFNRRMVNSANEIFALAAGRRPDLQTTDDVSGLAARALDLSTEHPNTMSFILVGLIVTAHRDGHDDLASLLAGYLSTHLAALALPARSAESFLGGPLDRFVTAETRASYGRGQTMTEAGLRAELERLAHDVRQPL